MAWSASAREAAVKARREKAGSKTPKDKVTPKRPDPSEPRDSEAGKVDDLVRKAPLASSDELNELLGD